MAEAKTEKEPPRQSRAWFAPGSITYFLYLYERPVGSGVLVGSAWGALDSLICSIPVLASTFIGAAIGRLGVYRRRPGDSVYRQHRQLTQAIMSQSRCAVAPVRPSLVTNEQCGSQYSGQILWQVTRHHSGS